MGFRDVLFVLLLLVNGFLGYTIYAFQTQKNVAHVQVAEIVDEIVVPSGEGAISLTEYNTIFMLKNVLPEELFMGAVLPLMKKYMADGYISQNEWKILEAEIMGLLGSNKLLFPSLFMQTLEERSLRQNMQDAFEGMGKTLSGLGSEVEEGMSGVLKKLNRGMERILPQAEPEKNDGTTI